MTSDRFREDAVRLGWSLWCELGVSGWAGDHKRWFIDPEPLILWTAWLGDADARLRDEVTDWCVAFGSWISGTRLANLLGLASVETRAGFGELAATVAAHSATRWRGATTPRRFERTGRSRLESFTAPSQVSLRLRGLFGVGARAEVVRVLFAERDAHAASALAEEIAFGKRIVSETLDSLRRSGAVEEHRVKNQLRYRMIGATEWSSVLGEMPVVWPRWSRILPLLIIAAECVERSRRQSARVAAVEAQKVEQAIASSAYAAQLSPPGSERSDVDRVDRLEAWATQTLRRLADADAPVAQRP